MREFKEKYHKLEDLPSKRIDKLSIDEIFVEINGILTPLSKLFVVTQEENKDKKKELKTRQLTSLADFNKNISKKKVCLDKDGASRLPENDNKLFYQIVPEIKLFDSTTINPEGGEKVAEGLKRTLSVRKAKKGDVNIYLQVKIAGEWTFRKKDEIFWFDGSVKKNYNDLPEGENILNKTFYDANNNRIYAVYTENEFAFDYVVAEEKFDFENLVQTTYTRVNDKFAQQEHKIDAYISEQEFVKVEEPVLNSSKTQMVSKRKVRNFHVNSSGEGQYVAITVNGCTKLVNLDNLVDETGGKIDDFSKMVGKTVLVKDDDEVVAKSGPVSYQEANLSYDSIKVYQLIEFGEMSDESLLRLDNGDYVSEKKTIQPLSYKLVDKNDTEFDKYLVEQKDGEVTRFVIVDKDYFEKTGKSNLTVHKIKRCNFNDKDCSIVQTTSQIKSAKEKDSRIEQCSIIKKEKVFGESVNIEDKEDVYDAFVTGYSNGTYEIEDVYVNGELKKIETPGKRYEYTDTFYLQDKADDLIQYKAIKTDNVNFKDGKADNKIKYNVGNAIANSYAVWGQILGGSIVGLPVVGIFIPVVGPIVAAVGGIGLLAAIPMIPIVNLGIGLVKNGNITRLFRKLAKYKDKTEYDRGVDVDNITKSMEILFNKVGKLNKSQFKDNMSQIENLIIALSTTTNQNVLNVENGETTVTAENVNLLITHSAEYNRVSEKVNFYEKKVADVKKEIETLEKSAKSYKDRGKNVPDRISKQLRKKKAEFKVYDEKLDEWQSKQSKLKNISYGESYGAHAKRQELITKLASLKLFACLKNPEYQEDVSLSELTEDHIKRISFDAKKGLLIDGKKVFDKDGTIDKQTDEWKALRNILLTKVKSIEVSTIKTVKKPIEIKSDPMTDDTATARKPDGVANANGVEPIQAGVSVDNKGQDANASAGSTNGEPDKTHKKSDVTPGPNPKKKKPYNEMQGVGEDKILGILKRLSECLSSKTAIKNWAEDLQDLYKNLKTIETDGKKITREELLKQINGMIKTLDNNIKNSKNTKFSSAIRKNISNTTANFLLGETAVVDGQQIGIFDNQ